jgi:hypothetical protein
MPATTHSILRQCAVAIPQPSAANATIVNHMRKTTSLEVLGQFQECP